MLTQHLHSLLKLLLRHALGTAQYDGACVLYLVIEELAEVLHIHLAFLTVYDYQGAVDVNVHMASHILNSLHNVGQLAYA